MEPLKLEDLYFSQNVEHLRRTSRMTYLIPEQIEVLTKKLSSKDSVVLEIAYAKEVKIALKVISVLEPKNANQLLSAAKHSFRSKDSLLIVSYPILKGRMYEQNEKRAVESNQQLYF